MFSELESNFQAKTKNLHFHDRILGIFLAQISRLRWSVQTSKLIFVVSCLSIVKAKKEKSQRVEVKIATIGRNYSLQSNPVNGIKLNHTKDYIWFFKPEIPRLSDWIFVSFATWIQTTKKKLLFRRTFQEKSKRY